MGIIKKLLGLTAISLLVSLSLPADIIKPTTGAGIIQLSELSGIEKITYLAGEHCMANKSTNGNPITIMGTVYESGIGTHAPSVAVVELNGAKTFHAILGVDDEADVRADHGIVNYIVTLYGKDKADQKVVCSGTLDRQAANYAYVLDIADIADYTYLKLEYAQGAQAWADHADWADARFTYSGDAPRLVAESEMFLDESKIVRLPTTATTEGAQIIPLSSLDLTLCTNGWGKTKADCSIDGNPLKMKGIQYASGVGIHTTAKIVVKLNGATTKFHATLGIDDEVLTSNDVINNHSASTVAYDIILRAANGKETSMAAGLINAYDAEAVDIDLDNLTEYKYLIINLSDYNGNSNDHVDIGNAYFEYLYQNSTPPEMVSESVLATSLFSATTLYSQPGVKFMHKLRTLNDDATISVRDLPEGLTFNAKRNLVEGVIEQEGEYSYMVDITSGDEVNETPVTLTVSSHLQQPTPFMGWLSWNVVEGDISNSVVEVVADAMVESGLKDAGFHYIVIDDLWHASSREADGTPRENPTKFPKGMKAAADYVHDRGMKFGIYSDAGQYTCAGAYGSLNYENIDAKQYAKWGIDLLKYDYCNAPSDLDTAKKRYKDMGDALKNSGRDIIFYICEWGVREPWKWGAEAGGTCWRASYDTRDCWSGANGGVGVLQSINAMKNLWSYNGVNRWNDADMMCVGIHGTGKSSSDLCGTGPGMTQAEYATQFALWCMWSSPLTLSFDLRKPISDADKALMTNPELIALDQDCMGQAAELIAEDNDFVVFAKDLENDDVAVSVTNLAAGRRKFTIRLADIPALDAAAEYSVRDIINRTAAPAAANGALECGYIDSHATVVYRLSKQLVDSVVESEASKALSNMTATIEGDKVRICLPGTAGVNKRLLICDFDGRVLANTTNNNECITLSVPVHGAYIIHAICAGHSHSIKLAL
ncbi:MAG: NPCBM/NEW2 domain-containing protein [Prevotellaceae bacterium]|nr:NPCBM/NEW2 domain-containing protein [Prevotellaceae bacterium]